MIKVLIVLTLLSSSLLGQEASMIEAGYIEDGWKGIKPLVSDKAKVEKLLGKPRVDSNGYHGYTTPEVFIQVNYSTQPCLGDQYNRGRFNVPKDSVLDYAVNFKAPTKLSVLKFDRESYSKKTGYHLANVFYLYSRDEAIRITAGLEHDGEYVGQIYFRPAKVDAERFKCN